MVDAEAQGPAAAVFGVVFKNQLAAFMDAGQRGQLLSVVLALAEVDLIIVEIIIDAIITEGYQPALVDCFFKADLINQLIIDQGKNILIIQPFRGGGQTQQKFWFKIIDNVLK